MGKAPATRVPCDAPTSVRRRVRQTLSRLHVSRIAYRTFVLRIPATVVKLSVVAQISGRQPLGIFMVLSTGFDAITRQLWLLTLPAALDLFLWLGPRLKAPGMWSLFVFEIPAGLDANTRLFAQDFQDSLRYIVQNANWFAWLRPALLGVPGLSGALV